VIKKLSLLFILILAASGFQNTALSQDLTPKERDEIKSKAIGLVKEFELLLNVLATKGTTSSDVLDIVTQATVEEGRFFYDDKVILEDDISSLNPDSGSPKDVTIQKYLNDWDLFYSKSYDESVNFSDLRLSDIISTKYQFVKVYYLSNFKNKNKDFERNYKAQKRIAQIRFEKKGDNWVAWINGISFYTGKKADGTIITPETFEEIYKPFVKEARIRLVSAVAINDSTITEVQINLQKKNDSLYAEAVKAQVLKSQEQIRKDSSYAKAILKGDSLLSVQLFAASLEAYTEARSFKPYEKYPRTKVNELTHLLSRGSADPQVIFKQQLDDGDKLFRSRDYEGARQIYQLALNIIPDNPEARSRIQSCETIIRNKAEVRSKYTAGNFKLALKDYAKLISNEKTNPVYYLERAKCYQTMGDNKKALPDLNKAIELDGYFSEALESRALTFIKLNDQPKAISDYASLISATPENPEYHLRRGMLLSQMNDLDAAIKDFDKVFQLNPKEVFALIGKSEVLRRKEKYDEAIVLADKAIEMNPNIAGGQFQKGLAYLYQGFDEKAANSLFKANKIGLSKEQERELDKISNEFVAKAKEAEAANDVKKAINLIKRAIAVKARSSENYYFLAVQFEKSGLLNEALQALDQAIFIKDDYGLAYLKKGQILLLQKESSSSLEPFYKSRKLDYKIIEPCLGLGDAFVEMSQFDSAMVWYGEALEIKPNFSPALIKRGKCHFRMENYRRALMDFEEAIKQDRKSAEAFFLKGKINKELKQTDNAIDDFNKAMDLGFSKYECAIQIGASYTDLGSNNKAIRYFTDAIKIDPNKGEGYARRGICYIKDEDYKNAMADLDEALKIDTSLAKAANRTELGFLKLRFNDLNEAEKNFNRALDFDYLDPRANYGLGASQYLMGKTELAMRSFEQAFIPRKLDINKIKKDPWMKTILKDKDFKRLVKSYFK